MFQTGEPVFRKYDQRGELVFERRIQGREIDEFVGQPPDDLAAAKTSPTASCRSFRRRFGPPASIAPAGSG